ncbi:glycine cleavage system aminomethyltransferase GcvT [Paenibacillus xylaniclasticus]|uniref:glycine cleavage system aminomethyltransferase GcvT n=1 Tax=Paenibacillus xylaniclasticus TaxID=588083 RepID=UPI0013DF5526|nr:MULTISPECIES: glycine cleavage system aminomethyltransferase GcvT [Paenibacillus]GFN31527.1 aminomethyltransferase [Paenibacillus curdlanolyticus]
MAVRKRTPLYPLYAQYQNARCVDFAGWELPVQFTGTLKEHQATRQAAGLFDVSHMGRLLVTGKFAETYLQRLTTNNVSTLKDGRAQYTLLCNSTGGVIDDLLIYRLTADQYMLVVNAANTAADLEWLREQLIGDVTLQDLTESTALLALQGPNAMLILTAACRAGFDPDRLANTVNAADLNRVPLTAPDTTRLIFGYHKREDRSAQDQASAIAKLAPFHFIQGCSICGIPALVSRTGYTGEDGFELYTAAADAPTLWASLLQAGERLGLQPAGLGARDTLRLEARLPLYGHELSETITPIEAGLRSFVKLSKGDFFGRSALLHQINEGPARQLVGIEITGCGIPRAGFAVYANGTPVGYVTSGTHSPTLRRNIGLALLDSRCRAIGTELTVDIRGTHYRAAVVPTPFYSRPRTTLDGR